MKIIKLGNPRARNKSPLIHVVDDFRNVDMFGEVAGVLLSIVQDISRADEIVFVCLEMSVEEAIKIAIKLLTSAHDAELKSIDQQIADLSLKIDALRAQQGITK